MSRQTPLHLFEGYGIEIEYMIVDAATLDVAPLSDRLLGAVAGDDLGEVEMGPLAWSNELVLHVVELKTNGPSPVLTGLDEAFHADVRRIDELLRPHGARLLPGGTHPWMDPATQTRLWPHDHGPVYAAFDRIFDCRGHGWANLQATHLNLPFADDEEFARLHAAVRLVLPLLPALAASSPIMEGRPSGKRDTRVDVYRTNCRRIPSVTGRVVPEPVWSRATYEGELLRRMYADVAPLDPEGILQEEWLNARGAIARFDRMALEIRLLDVQECPRADLAIAALIVDVVRSLVEERWQPLSRQQSWPVEPLAAILERCVTQGEDALVDDPDYLAAFGIAAQAPLPAKEVWRHLVEGARALPADAEEPLRVILDEGTLATRLLDAVGPTPSREDLVRTWSRLADHLAENRILRGR